MLDCARYCVLIFAHAGRAVFPAPCRVACVTICVRPKSCTCLYIDGSAIVPCSEHLGEPVAGPGQSRVRTRRVFRSGNSRTSVVAVTRQENTRVPTSRSPPTVWRVLRIQFRGTTVLLFIIVFNFTATVVGCVIVACRPLSSAPEIDHENIASEYFIIVFFFFSEWIRNACSSLCCYILFFVKDNVFYLNQSFDTCQTMWNEIYNIFDTRSHHVMDVVFWCCLKYSDWSLFILCSKVHSNNVSN